MSAIVAFLSCAAWPNSELIRRSVQAVFQCPRRECHRIFIADYCQFNQDPHSGDKKFHLQFLSPFWFKKKAFPEPIKKVSQSFCEIFNEAARAESLKLSNVAGPGYRKALEFLVKDFLISQNPDKSDEIKKTWLQVLIKKEIQDANLKACAERATWLGNDETHYLRKWEDKDIEDLKTLITLCVNWTENCILTQEFKGAMPGKS